MKIAINKCYGGFSLSKEAYEYMGLEWDGYGSDFKPVGKRTDEKLIECIEKLGKKANGMCASLRIVNIPDEIEYEIDNYDGFETVREKHRSW